jgi:hypothetical protein
MVEDWLPRSAFAGAFPNSAATSGDVDTVRRIAGDGDVDDTAACARGSYGSPGKVFEKTLVELLSREADYQD